LDNIGYTTQYFEQKHCKSIGSVDEMLLQYLASKYYENIYNTFKQFWTELWEYNLKCWHIILLPYFYNTLAMYWLKILNNSCDCHTMLLEYLSCTCIVLLSFTLSQNMERVHGIHLKYLLEN
jgi:hypothetical protein